MFSLTLRQAIYWYCCLLFGRNYLVIFILAIAFYSIFGIFYSIFKIRIFVSFCSIQSVVFCGFLVLLQQIIQYIFPVLTTDFLNIFISFLEPFVPTCLYFLQRFPQSSFCHLVVLIYNLICRFQLKPLVKFVFCSLYFCLFLLYVIAPNLCQ